MSGDEFEVRGPHEESLEGGHEEGRQNPLAGRLALTTALLATVGALFGYMAGLTQADAILYKNSAAIRTTEASDQWNFYQAKSNKQNLAELGMALTGPSQQQTYAAAIERYGHEKSDIKREAERLTAESKHMDELSEQSMHVHHRPRPRPCCRSPSPWQRSPF